MKYPIISVCIPVYNGARFLPTTIESILRQTFSDFEVIVVDDCSTDESVDIVRSFAQTDNRFRVFHNAANSGITQNWNRCVSEARGEWIKFVHQDDVLQLSCIEKMLSASRAGRVVLCERDFKFDEMTPPDALYYFTKVKKRLSDLLPGVSLLSPRQVASIAIEYMDDNVFVEPSATLIHRSCFVEFGGFSDMLCQLCDVEFLVRVASNIGVVYVDQKLLEYRVHPHSATYASDPINKLRRERLDPLIVAMSYLELPQYANLRGSRGDAQKRIEAGAVRLIGAVLDELRSFRTRRLPREHLLALCRSTVDSYPGIRRLRRRAAATTGRRLQKAELARSLLHAALHRRVARRLVRLARGAAYRVRCAGGACTALASNFVHFRQ